MSSVTGDGIKEFFEAVDASREEYERYVNSISGDTFSCTAGSTFQNLSGRERLGINPYKMRRTNRWTDYQGTSRQTSS